jgi:alkanesulfonate monooxygenase SsuD/methylene tetrahydromethanopterin reductase-like flavin-dependent oxidoreductase (luciferase family)
MSARTVRQLLRHLAGARGHLVFCGTPVATADLVEEWITGAAADGFNVMPPVFPDQFEAFVDEVVPLLRRRGLRPAGYVGATLRERYGLARPASRYTREPVVR